MPDTTTLNENIRSIDGTEWVRLVTAGAMWRAQLSAVATYVLSQADPLIAGGSAANSTLTLESTTGAGTSDAIIFKTGSQVEAARIDTGQRFTINQTSQLDVSGAGSLFQINGNIAQFNWQTNAFSSAVLFTKSRGGGTPGTKGTLSSGDNITNFSFAGVDASGTPAFQEAASIKVYVDASPVAGNVPGRIVFSTASTTGEQDAFWIDSKQQQRFMFTPTAVSGTTQAQIRADDQSGLSIATSSNAFICSGHGNLVIVLETTNSSMAIYTLTGGGTALVSANNLGGFSWVAGTTTPAASQASIAFDGASNYRIYTGSGLGTRTYKAFIIKIAG